MAVVEAFPRSGSDASDKSQDEYIYTVTGADTQDEVAAQLNAELPATVGILKRSSYDYVELGGGRWTAKVRYVSKDHPERKDNNNQPSHPAAPVRLGTPGKWSRANQLGNVRVNVSLDTASYPPGAPSFNGLIELDSQGSAKGADRLAMAKEWVFEKCIAFGAYTQAWLQSIDDLDLTTNASTFFWMPENSALFLGMTLTPEEEAVRAVLRFGTGKNETGLEIGGISGVDKFAHDHLWAYYKREPDANVLASKVKAIYVETLYPEGDWSAIETFVGMDAVGGPS